MPSTGTQCIAGGRLPLLSDCSSVIIQQCCVIYLCFHFVPRLLRGGSLWSICCTSCTPSVLLHPFVHLSIWSLEPERGAYTVSRARVGSRAGIPFLPKSPRSIIYLNFYSCKQNPVFAMKTQIGIFLFNIWGLSFPF